MWHAPELIDTLDLHPSPDFLQDMDFRPSPKCQTGVSWKKCANWDQNFCHEKFYFEETVCLNLAEISKRLFRNSSTSS